MHLDLTQIMDLYCVTLMLWLLRKLLKISMKNIMKAIEFNIADGLFSKGKHIISLLS